jgi:NH3-dependent NAD+ synthetase
MERTPKALFVLTSSLRYLALGWCTYGVGGQMAHYSVNASVPKTLIQHLICWIISSEQLVTFRRKGKKKPSKQFREQFGHLPLSVEEGVPGNAASS